MNNLTTFCKDFTYDELESYFIYIFNNKTKYEIYNLDISIPSNYDTHNINCIFDIKNIDILIQALRLIFPNTNSDNIHARLVIIQSILRSCSTDEYDEDTTFVFKLKQMMWVCLNFLKRNDKLRASCINETIDDADSTANENSFIYLHQLDAHIITNTIKYKKD